MNPWEQDWSGAAPQANDKAPWEQDWGKPSDVTKGGVLDTVRDYTLAGLSKAGQGSMQAIAGMADTVSAPVAKTRAMLTGAAALADRWLPGDINPTLQELAQDDAAAAEAKAQQNALNNPLARGTMALRDAARERGQMLQDFDKEFNPELVRQEGEMSKAQGFWENAKAIKDNPLAFYGNLMQSAPAMATGIGMSSGAARAAGALGKVAGMSDEAALALATRSAGAVGTASEAALSGSQAREGIRSNILATPHAQLAENSPRYQELMSQPGMTPALARDTLANEVSTSASLLTSAATALGSTVTNRVFGNLEAQMIAGNKLGAKDALLKMPAKETAEEAAQGMGEDYVQHRAMLPADKTNAYDPGGSFVQNAAAGLAMSGPGSVGGYARQQYNASRGLNPDGTKPATPPAAPPADVAMDIRFPDGTVSKDPGQTDSDTLRARYEVARKAAMDAQADPGANPRTIMVLNAESDRLGKEWQNSLKLKGAVSKDPAGGKFDYAAYDQYRTALESGGRADAKNPNSSATGLHQFTERTWLATVEQAKPAWANGLSREQILDARTDPAKSTEMVRVLDKQNATRLASEGQPVNEHTLYAAHHFGAGRAVDFAKAGDDVLMSNILSPSQMRANPYLEGLTKAQAIANWDSRAGGAPATASPAAKPAAESDIASTEADAAAEALQPREAADVDKVAELDKQAQALERRWNDLNTPEYGPTFDTERADLQSQIAALRGEREQLAKDWPKPEYGHPTSFATESGVRLDGRYALVDADALVTSHNSLLNKNGAYPQELQPRERDRAASEAQISGIVNKLDPARLGMSADAATGAPIIGADGVVESGNARTIALMRAYEANGQKAAEYRQFLSDNANQFGLSAEQVGALKNPVLVRVRDTPVDRAEFARQANASTVAAMSPSEQARSDAQRIDNMEDLTPNDDGDFATSRDFIRRFMARLPMTEQAGMVDSSGALSTAGYARVRNAVLAKAYGDSPVLQRLTESMDDNLRNISKALVMAAPEVAKMRSAIDAGARFDVDITPDLMAAVTELSRLKDAGTSVQDAIAQVGMFGEYSTEVRDLLQFLADNIRRPRRIADFVRAYYAALDQAGNPNQGSLLGETAPPAKGELMNAARQDAQGELLDGNTATPTRSATAATGDPGRAQAGPEGRVQRSDEARRGQGDQVDGAARSEAAVAFDFDATEKALEAERDATSESIESEWVNSKTGAEHRRRTDLESAIYDAVTSSSLDAENAGPIVDTAIQGGRLDLAEYAVKRAENYANSMGTTPGVSPSSPKYDGIKQNLERAKAQAIKAAAELRAKLEQAKGRRESPTGQWRAFPPDMGSLGIPRAEMPQIKGEHRGAFIQFLKGRGIEASEQHEVDAAKLKPTQAEFSMAKVEGFLKKGLGSGRSVLVSSDGYVLDGHHQWMAHAAANQDIPVITLNAPMRELLKAAHEFPSVQRSEGASNDPDASRREAVQDFKAAMADLADIATKWQRAALMPEKDAELMPVLARLFDAAIRIVGTDMRAATRWVKDQLRANPETKRLVNKIEPMSFRKAAEQAFGAMSEPPAQGGLFDSLEQASQAVQGDMFGLPEARPYDKLSAEEKAAFDRRQGIRASQRESAPRKVTSENYDAARDNYSPPDVSSFMPKEALAAADKVIAEHQSEKRTNAAPTISADDRARAESLLTPVLAKAAEAKAEFDQKVIDIAQRVGALGQQLAPLKGLKRGAEKLVEEKFDVGGMKDLLRSTIVVRSYADAQAVMDAIESEFKLLRAPKNRTGDAPLRAQGKDVAPEDPAKYAGYSDIMVNVVMPNGTIAEIQINTPDMLAAKGAQWHKLYEVLRAEPKGSATFDVVNAASLAFYAEARAAARNSSSVMRDQSAGQNPLAGLSPSQGAFSSSQNRLPSGNSTYDRSMPSPSARSMPKTQPGGNLSGTFMGSPDAPIVGGKGPGVDGAVSDKTAPAADDALRQRFTLPVPMFGDVPYRASAPVDAGGAEVLSSRVMVASTKLTKRDVEVLGLSPGKTKVYAWRVSVVSGPYGVHSIIEAMDADHGRSSDGEVLARFKEVSNAEHVERVAPAVARAARADFAAQAQELESYTSDDLRQRDNERQQADAAEQRQRQDDARRVQADAERGDFTLTGSDRAVDVAEAHGQQTLLSRAERGPDAQYRDTERAYGGKPAYDKAKAAGKTKLTYGQWVEVRTPNFKAWFGDWENDPKNASKVINAETGEPLVVYHGTDGDFTSFSTEKLGSNTGAASARRGFFFASNPKVSDFYSKMAFEDLTAPVRAEWDQVHKDRPAGGKWVGGYEGDFVLESDPSAGQAYKERVLRARSAFLRLGETEKEYRKLDRRKSEISHEVLSDYGIHIADAINVDASFLDENPYFAELMREYVEVERAWNEIRMEFGYMHGANVIPVYLKILNPLVHDFRGERYRDVTYNELIKQAQDQGHDGVILKNTFDTSDHPKDRPMTDVYVAFRPSQIKSATGNNGTFDLGNPDIRMSSNGAAAQQRSMPVADLQTMTDRVAKALPNLPKVNVLQSTQDTRGELRAYLERQGAMGDAEGAFHKGELYLFADNLASMERAEHVLATHEAGHAGLAAILGADRARVMQSLLNLNDDLNRRANAVAKRLGVPVTTAVEELLVDVPPADLVKLKGWRRVAHKVQQWLARSGFTALAARMGRWLESRLSDQQKADLLAAELMTAAREHLAGRKPAVRGMTVDAQQQAKWLNKQAAQRGYENADAMALADFDGLESLMAQWRGKNPAAAMLARRIVRGGYRTVNDSVIPETPEYEGNLTGDLAQVPAGKTIKAGPIRLPVGMVLGSHRGYGVEHMGDNARKEPHRAPKAETGELAEDLVRQAVEVLRGVREVHHDGRSVIFPNPLMKLVVVADWREDHYDIATVRPYDNAIRLWGVPERIGRLTFPIRDAAAASPSLTVARESSLHPDRSGLEVASERFYFNTDKPKPATQVVVKKKRTIQVPDGAPRLSRAISAAVGGGTQQNLTPSERADALIQKSARTAQPLDAVAQAITRATGVEWAAKKVGGVIAGALNRYTPESVKAGLVSDYGLDPRVRDERVLMQARQQVQLRKAGEMIDSLASLTREESAAAYRWMNETDPDKIIRGMDELPEGSAEKLQEIQRVIDKLSQEAVDLGQLDQRSYERNKFAYLHRSYAKHVLEPKGAKAARARTVAILGNQYKGRGTTETVAMSMVRQTAPEWWDVARKAGKADPDLIGKKLTRYDRLAPSGAGTQALPGMDGRSDGRVLETVYLPADRAAPKQYAEWRKGATFEVRDVKRGDLTLWRDWTADERQKMGEIDEARFAIAKTLHGMIRDVEVGRFLGWLSRTQAKPTEAQLPAGASIVDASESLLRAFVPGEWVKVPETTIAGTAVKKYGELAGKYVEGPVWNEVRQALHTAQGFGKVYGAILNAWKLSKALALDTPLPTPGGWTTMGDLQVGDTLFDENGKPCTVLGKSEVWDDHDCYRVEFSDGTSIVADAGHLWMTIYQGKPGIRETTDILATLKNDRGDNLHRIPVAGALDIDDAELPVDPYVFGYWLGDGDKNSARLTLGGHDLDEATRLLEARDVKMGEPRKDKRNDAYEVRIYSNGGKWADDSIQSALRSLGVLGNKHIPALYLRASVAQRRALLRGIMDSDGCAAKGGMTCRITTSTPRLGDGILELIRSLGLKPRGVWRETYIGDERKSDSFQITFAAYIEDEVFTLPRKLVNLRNRPATRQRSKARSIVGIVKVDPVPVQCILVSSPSHLFLAGDGMIPTHNTAMSPTVHMNNIMSNFVMADWHDVTAGHVAKALRIIMGAHDSTSVQGIIGLAGKGMKAAAGMADQDAARELVKRYKDSGAELGSFVVNETMKAQVDPLLAAMEAELRADPNSTAAQVGVMSALQLLRQGEVGAAAKAAAGAQGVRQVIREGGNMIDLYQSEDSVFRLASWLKAKEEGKTDIEAGRIARHSFMDYNINAPWVQAARKTVLPFISYTYRAAPMLADIAMNKPHKILKLMAVAGAIDLLGSLLAGGGADDDKVRKLLPKEKAGGVWGMVPKLIRMPWNDDNGSPVFLDIRRWVPMGDVFDLGQGHAALPIPPSLMPGGPLALAGELIANKSQFTGKPIVLETDTAGQKAGKVADFVYKWAAPNVLGLPGSYATTGVIDAAKGRTDAFGRERSVAQAIASSIGVKAASYPRDILERNIILESKGKQAELERGMRQLARQRSTNAISDAEFERAIGVEQGKLRKLREETQERLEAGRTH